MLRYYMTSETRQSLIEESNRQIAMRAIASAASGRRVPAAAAVHAPADAANDETESDWSATVSESAFARLVAELEAGMQTSANERHTV
jgi:hypothetical protein